MEKVRAPAEIALDGYAAWNSRDVEAFIDTVHPEIVWETAGIFPGLRSSYTGHDGIRKFWADFMEPWERLEIGADAVAEIDANRVLTEVHFHATGREGIEVDRQFVNYMEIKEGKLHRYHGFADWAHALDELGIEDPREGAVSDGS